MYVLRVCVCPCAIGTAVSAGTATAASRCCRRLPLRSPGRLASASTALHRVNAIKEDVRWERGAAAAVLDAAMVEMPLTGMQMALEMMMDKKCCNKLLDHDHHHIIMEMRDQIRLALLTPSSNKQQTAAADGGGAFISKPQISSLCLPTRKTTTLQLAPWLFLFSLYQLRAGLLVANNANASVNMKVAPAAQESEEEEGRRQQAAAATADNPCWFPFRFRRRQLLAAAKCGFSLGLAVLLGLLFSNDHGFVCIVVPRQSEGRSRRTGDLCPRVAPRVSDSGGGQTLGAAAVAPTPVRPRRRPSELQEALADC